MPDKKRHTAAMSKEILRSRMNTVIISAMKVLLVLDGVTFVLGVLEREKEETVGGVRIRR
jgi:hypothetical protein